MPQEERAPTLVVMALELEAQGLFERDGVEVLYTGIGKVNATYVLTRRLAQMRNAGAKMPHVINFGTAGSHTFATGSLVACTCFVQRDMDLTALGFAPGTTPFESLPPMLEFPVTLPHLPHGVCSSGDSFETRGPVLARDVLDMEGYALAKVCTLEKVSFTCVKYVTDGADHAAAGDWHANLPKAAVEFLTVYRTLERSFSS
jgi:adenosylhomocysteine nucleosidase